MAKGKSVDTSLLSSAEGQKELGEARKRALRKLADAAAAQELGLEEGGAVIKGPLPVAGEEMMTISLNMYPGADRMVIDGKIYQHGATYTVNKRLYDTMQDIVARGWDHQAEIEGKDRNFYRKQSNILISPGGVKAA